MKTALIYYILLSTLCGTVCAQTVDTTIDSSDGKFMVTERGPHHRVWTRSTESGTESYTELATGMHVQDANGQFVEASDLVESFSGGAVARHGQIKVIFANNLATPGAIDAEGPDGVRFQCHLLGLSYLDKSTGLSVLLAEVKDCQGKIVGIGTNSVLYEDAMTDIPVDVLYVYSLAGFEQFVILKSPTLPAPEEWGLNSSTTVLQVLTELAQCNPSSVSDAPITESSGVSLSNQNIGMEGMFFGNGGAFRLGAEGIESSLPMGKEISVMENRRFLVEEASARGIINELKSVQWEGGAIPSSAGKIKRTALVQFRRFRGSKRVILGVILFAKMHL